MHTILKCIGGPVVSGECIDMVGLWTFSLVIVGFFAFYVAKKQLNGISKTTKADFIRRFSKDFFKEQTRDLIMLFDYNALSFRNANIEYGEDIESKPFPYFLVDANEKILKQFKIDTDKQEKISKKKYYSSYEIDDYLLGFFENLGEYERKGLINIEGIYDNFDWYLDIIWNNEEIKKYIECQTEDEKEGDDIYENFRYIYQKCDSYNKAKLSNRWIWWWKIKWFISYTCMHR